MSIQWSLMLSVVVDVFLWLHWIFALIGF